MVAALRDSMQLDAAATKGALTDAANWPDAAALWPQKKQRDSMVEKVRENIEAGLLQVQRQPLDDYLT